MAALKPVQFSKKLGCPSSASPEILAFGSHCSANFQPILNCFMPNFKLKYEDSENIKADSVNKVIFNLLQAKRRAFFYGTPGRSRTRPKSFKRKRDTSSSSSRSDSSPEYGDRKESKKSKRARSHKPGYVECYSSSQSERTKSKTKPKDKSMPKYKKNKHKKKKSKTKKQSKENHSESPRYYTVLLKIDRNENRDAVLFENHGRETTTILKFSARNFKTYYKMLAF